MGTISWFNSRQNAVTHRLRDKAATSRLDLGMEVEYITDMKKIMAYGVMRLPALVFNEKAVSMGRVLKSSEVEKLLKG